MQEQQKDGELQTQPGQPTDELAFKQTSLRQILGMEAASTRAACLRAPQALQFDQAGFDLNLNTGAFRQ